MIVLADENVHRLIARRLTADGHDVAHVADLAPSITDVEVLALAVGREALVITNDLDFGELIYRGGSRHAGVLLLRLGEMPYAEQAAHVSAVLSAHGPALEGAFSVLDKLRLRIRG